MSLVICQVSGDVHLALVSRWGQVRLVTVTLRLEERPCWDTQVKVSESSSLA